MSWAHCGEDSKGREIGYAIEATCDHPGCNERIDRGLGHACGGMHGTKPVTDENDCCEGYFCSKHLGYPPIEDDLDQRCEACSADLVELASQYPESFPEEAARRAEMEDRQ